VHWHDHADSGTRASIRCRPDRQETSIQLQGAPEVTEKQLSTLIETAKENEGSPGVAAIQAFSG
jgi:hypothetical protein